MQQTTLKEHTMLRHRLIKILHFHHFTLLCLFFLLSSSLSFADAHAASENEDIKSTFWLSLLLKNNCTSASITGAYLLSFHVCNTESFDCSDPRNHFTYVAESNDGSSWSLVPGYIPHQGSVPDLIRRENTLYVYNIGTVKKYDFKTCKWTESIPVTVEQSDGTPENYADPSLIVDSFGRLVMFYLVTEPGSDPARCKSGEPNCTKTFRSATEEENGDGTVFTVDAGDRATVTITSSEAASDPDIFTSPDGYVLYISRGMSVQALSSPTLLGNYSNISGLTNGMLANATGGIPSGYYDTTANKYWTYAHKNSSGKDIIRRAVHDTVDTEVLEASFNNIISGSDFEDLGSSFSTASPGFAPNIE